MSALIHSINQGMVSTEIDSALRMFRSASPQLAMAASHLHSAKAIAPFSGDPDQSRRIEETLAAIKHLGASFEALTKPTEKVITSNPDEQAQ